MQDMIKPKTTQITIRVGSKDPTHFLYISIYDICNVQA